MATKTARVGIGFAVSFLLLVNGSLVLARTGENGPMSQEERSARSASLALDSLDEKVPVASTTTAAPAQGSSTRSGEAGAVSTTRAPKASTATTTTTTVVVATTSTTVKPAGGVVGPGLYVVAPDGTGVRRLVSGYGMHSWSPDGSRLAWSDGTDLLILRADGSGRTTVPGTKGAVAPAWSPDGTRIAFGRSGTWVVAADGSTPPALVEPSGYLTAWTPDNRLVVMTHPQTGGYPSIVVHDKDGTRRVIAADGDTTVGPSPSPDGRYVAYLGQGIFTANVDGTGSRAVTPACCSSSELGSPIAWSPDSRRIGFKHQGDTWVVGADGSGYGLLVPNAIAPTWSSDGRLAVIGTKTIEPGTLLHLTLQLVEPGGGLRMVFDAGDGFSVQSPAWSPTGRLLAVSVGTERLSGLVSR